jgi:spermidine/putrescine transport system ATP-binding protein
MAVADIVVVMNAGRIEDRGPPDRVYLRPRTFFSAGFMGEINMLPVTVRERGADAVVLETVCGILRLPGDALAGTGPEVTLLIRPEHFREPGEGALELGTARVEDAAFFGTHVRAHVRLGDLPLVAHFPQGTRLAPGEAVVLRVHPALTALAGRS